MSRILVTGATGFIGRNLVRVLIKNGYHIRALVRDVERAERILGRRNIEYVVGDVRDRESLKNISDGITAVYHLAAITGHDSPSESAFRRYREVNVEGTKIIAESCLGRKIGKFIYISSTAAIGLSKDKVVNEETPCSPRTPYQVSKYEAEMVVREFTRKYGLPGVILRPSMVFGVGSDGDLLTIARIVKRGIFPRIGFGRNLSPAVHVDDLVDCMISAKDKALVGETYIITSERSYATEEIVRIIAEALDVEVRMIFVPKLVAMFGAWIVEHALTALGKKPFVTVRNIESRSTDRLFDVTKAKVDLSFHPQSSIDMSLREVVAYYRSEGLV
jgi:dihydroflavonol-4-reductase